MTVDELLADKDFLQLPDAEKIRAVSMLTGLPTESKSLSVNFGRRVNLEAMRDEPPTAFMGEQAGGRHILVQPREAIPGSRIGEIAPSSRRRLAKEPTMEEIMSEGFKQAQGRYDETTDRGGYYLNEILQGATEMTAAPFDIPLAAAQGLQEAGIGRTGVIPRPEGAKEPATFGQMAGRAVGADTAMRPPDATAEFLGRVGKEMGAAAVTAPFFVASQSGRTAKAFLDAKEAFRVARASGVAADIAKAKQGLQMAGQAVREAGPEALDMVAKISAGSGIGAATMEQLAPDSTAGEVLGQVVGATLPGYAKIAPVTRTAKALISKDYREKVASDPTVKEWMKDAATKRLAEDLKSHPHAEKSILEARTLLSKTPGAKATPAQMSGAPGLIEQERRLQSISAETVNAAEAFNQANRNALVNKLQRLTPEGGISGRSAISQVVKQLDDEQVVLFNQMEDAKLAKIAAQSQAKTAKEVAEAGYSTAAKGIAEGLPTVAPEDTGKALLAIRKSEKSSADAAIKSMFNAPKEAAAGVEYDPSDIYTVAKRELRDPKLQYGPENEPEVLKLLKPKRAQAEVAGEDLATFMERQWAESGTQALSAETSKAIGYDDIKAMREAVNQDIARELASGTSEARQRVRALRHVMDAIDGTIQGGDPKVAELYRKAVDAYRDDYAPRFLKGINIKSSLVDRYGDPKISAERLVAAYFKPGAGADPAQRFIDLYGMHPKAVKEFEKSILNKYRIEVVKNGVIDPKAHEKFMSQKGYAAVLDKLSDAGINTKDKIADIGMAAESLAKQHADDLAKISVRETSAIESAIAKQKELAGKMKDIKGSPLAKVLAAGNTDAIMDSALKDSRGMMALMAKMNTVQRKAFSTQIMKRIDKDLRYADPDRPGIDPNKLMTFLTDNEKSLRMAFRFGYGGKAGKEHLSSLKEIARLGQIFERTDTPLRAGGYGELGSDIMKEAIGISRPTAFAQARAVITGRTSPELSVLTLTGQSAAWVLSKHFAEIERQMLYDPKTAADILAILKAPKPTAQTAAKMKNLLTRTKAMATRLTARGQFGTRMEEVAPRLGITSEAMYNNDKPQSANSELAVDIQDAPSDATLRKVGQVYNTPKGPLRWTGTGWLPIEKN